jgi:hypothetical protein
LLQLTLIARRLGRAVISILLLLLGFDIAGVVFSFLCDTFVSERQTSTALYYTIWFVDGVFCGLFCYIANDDSDRKKPDAQTGLLAVWTMPFILAALSFLFYRLFWRQNMAPSVFAPDNEGLTLTFFITVAVSMAFAYHVQPGKPAKKKRR